MPNYLVESHLVGQGISTTVDSEIAEYYLENFLNNDHTNPELDNEIEETLQQFDNRQLDAQSLKQLSEQFSTDFATLYFVYRIYQDPENRRAQRAFHSYLSLMRKGDSEVRIQTEERLRSYLFAFVPGYAYKRHTTTGADFARQRQIMNEAGFNTLLIETDEIGIVEIKVEGYNRGAELEAILREEERA